MPGKLFQPMADKPNPATYIRQGIVDQSGATSVNADTALLKPLGEMALDANKGYNIAELEKTQKKTIEDYMGPRKEGIELAGVRKSIDQMWENSDGSPESRSAITDVEKAYIERLNKYKEANAQGLMTPEEFQLRIMKETREAVNRLPGIYPELIAHSQKVLGLSGINDIVKADATYAASQQKQQQDTIKNVRELADKLNVSYDPFNMNLQEMVQGIHQRQSQIRASETIDAISKKQGFVDKQEAKNWVKTNGGNVILGDMHALNETFVTQFKGASGKDYDSLITSLESQAAERKARLIHVATDQGMINDPEVKDVIKAHNDALDSVLAMAKASGSGKNAADAMVNIQKRLEAEQQYNFDKQYDSASIKALRYIPDPVWSKWTLNNNVPALMAITSGLTNTFLNSPAFQKSLTSDVTKPGVPDAVSISFGIADSGNIEAFSKAATTVSRAVATTPFKKEEDKFKVMDGFMKELAAPQRKGKLAGMSDASMADTFSIADEYVQTSAKHMARKAQEFGDVRGEALPSGKLTFTGTDPAHVAFMNKEYAARINTTIDGIANMLNISTEAAARTVYPRYADIFSVQGRSGKVNKSGQWWKD